MNVQSSKTNGRQKTLMALLLCSGFLSGWPVLSQAGNRETNLEISQQKVKITGTVRDASGEPIIGASVRVKGEQTGSITDMEGKFVLSSGTNATLIISYVGFDTQNVALNGKTTLDVILKENSKSLDELVVVGFGTQKKVNLTGSVGIATADELESRPVTSATQALQGLVPGLNISTTSGALDQNMSISVRGVGTIGSSSGSPLILIDGMEGDLNTVNPQDIENISVLKDAAASSIYGSRAPFGVILVTTKKGKEGKVQVNYNNSFRFSTPLGLPESMDSYSFAVYMNEALENSGQQHQFKDDVLQKMLDYQAGKIGGGIDVSPTNPDAWEDEWSRGYANTDIYKELYKRNNFSQEHNVSLSGGSSKMSYYASFNYLDQGGLLNFGDDGLKRYNATGKISAKLAKWADFNFTTRFTRTDNWRPKALNNNFYNSFGRQNWPNIPMYDPNGNLFGMNALDLEQGGERNTQTDRFYYQTAFILEPIKNWRTNVEFNYSIMDVQVKETGLVSYYTGPTGIKRASYTQKNNYLYQDSKKENYLNLNVYSEYSYSFADKHNFKIMAGMQIEELKQRDFNVSKNGLVMLDMPEFNLVNGILSNGQSQDASVYGYSNEWATAGFFGRLNYDYKGRYLAEANLRYDGTSRFRRGSRWQWSPSFSLGWNIAQEKFWESLQNTVGTLKLRLSYGQLGNQNTNAWYPTYRTMSLGVLNGSWLQNGLRPNTSSVGSLISETLTWETVKTWNAGIDFGLFNNRLTGSFDYFVRYTKNMVGPAPELPATLGISAPQTNNCDLKTRGWELSLSWKDRLNNGLSYGITLSLSDQDTYIDSYPSNKTRTLSWGETNTGINWAYISGQKMNTIWGFQTVGIAKTQAEMDNHLASLPNGGQSAIGTQWGAGDIMYKDVNGDGKITIGSNTLDDHGDLVVLGDENPHYFFGADLTASWKGFDFRAFFQGVLKHDFWPGGDSQSGSGAAGGYFWGVVGNKSIWYMRGFKQHGDYFRDEAIGLDGHQIPANVDAYFPRPLLDVGDGGKNQRVQSRYLQNAAYVRLKNLQIGYTLPSKWMSKVGVSKCRLFVSGENLFTITSLFDVYDPETSAGGVGGNVYPLSRTWSCGLSLTF